MRRILQSWAWRAVAARALPVLVVLTAIRSAVAAPFHVPTGSMAPSIAIGDRILVSKLAYGLNVPWVEPRAGLTAGLFTTHELVRWAEPERGDIVLFRAPPDPSLDYVKRVVGVPGDEIAVLDGVVYVDGEALPRALVGGRPFVDGDCKRWPAQELVEQLGGVAHAVFDSMLRENPDFGPVVVPPGHLFVMGDNRDHSLDSRAWGMLPRDQVRGRVEGVWMSAGCEQEAQVHWRSL